MIQALRSALARAAAGWLLPLLLGLAAVLAYMLLIVPPKERPWYVRPPVAPGTSPTARAYTRYLGIVHEARQKAREPRSPAPAPVPGRRASPPPAPAPAPEALDPDPEPILDPDAEPAKR